MRSERKAKDGVLPLAIFNLEPLREHLETLQLRSNNLTAFPQQFGRPFGQLRHLDLSGNQFLSNKSIFGRKENPFEPQTRLLFNKINEILQLRTHLIFAYNSIIRARNVNKSATAFSITFHTDATCSAEQSFSLICLHRYSAGCLCSNASTARIESGQQRLVHAPPTATLQYSGSALVTRLFEKNKIKIKIK